MNGLFELLVIEHDEGLAQVIRTRLTLEGMMVESVASGYEGLRYMRERNWSLLVAETDLPDMKAEELLAGMRGRKLTGQPVILTTSTRDTHRIVRLLRMGATDIVRKPVVVEELIARIWGLLRLSGEANSRPAPIVEGDIRIDSDNRTVLAGGEEVSLTPTEFDLFVFLVRNKGRPLRRDYILSEVWGYAFAGNTNLVDVYIRYLRLKLDKKYKRKWIHTVRGVGYMFKPN